MTADRVAVLLAVLRAAVFGGVGVAGGALSHRRVGDGPARLTLPAAMALTAVAYVITR